MLSIRNIHRCYSLPRLGHPGIAVPRRPDPSSTPMPHPTAPRRAPDRAALDPIEIASRDELAALQLERLRWSVRHAYTHVAPYRAKCEAVGAHPDDLRDLTDLARFPFTVKDDLRQAYPFGLFAVPRERLARVHASSGTTGKPTVVGYTARDIDTWASLVARSIRAAGGRPGGADRRDLGGTASLGNSLRR